MASAPAWNIPTASGASCNGWRARRLHRGGSGSCPLDAPWYRTKSVRVRGPNTQRHHACPRGQFLPAHHFSSGGRTRDAPRRSFGASATSLPLSSRNSVTMTANPSLPPRLPSFSYTSSIRDWQTRRVPARGGGPWREPVFLLGVHPARLIESHAVPWIRSGHFSLPEEHRGQERRGTIGSSLRDDSFPDASSRRRARTRGLCPVRSRARTALPLLRCWLYRPFRASVTGVGC